MPPTDAPIFFFSYARIDDRGDAYIKKFYQDIVQEIRAQLLIPKESRDSEIGFFDAAASGIGEWWAGDLEYALRTSKVLVPLVSRAYFHSELCGKEFEVFRRRLEQYRQIHPRGPVPRSIMPVLWERPDKIRALPPVFREIRTATKEYGRVYSREGLNFIMRLSGKYETEYKQFCEKFATDLIQTTSESVLPEAPRLPTLHEVINPFAGDGESAAKAEAAPELERTALKGPEVANFVFLAASAEEIAQVRGQVDGYGNEGGRDWKPFVPANDQYASVMAQACAATENLVSTSWPIDASLIKNIKEAEQRNEAVIIVADVWTLCLKNYADSMREFDECSSLNSGVLLLWNDDEETVRNRAKLEDYSRMTFFSRYSMASPYFMDRIDSPEAFRDAISFMLNKIRRRISESTKWLRAINVDTKPSINRS